MKATKMFLILLAVVAMFTFACNDADTPETDANTQNNEEMENQEDVDPIDAWIGEVEAVVNEYEPKMVDGALPAADLEAFAAAKAPLMEKAQTLDLENKSTSEQKAKIEPLMARMDAIK